MSKDMVAYMAAKNHFYIDQGAPLDLVIHRVRTTTGANVDISGLSGGVLTMKTHFNAQRSFTLGVSFNANGEVTATANAATTAAIAPGRYVYDVVDDTGLRIVEGYVAVTPGVSPFLSE
jgi:hypothetical protein